LNRIYLLKGVCSSCITCLYTMDSIIGIWVKRLLMYIDSKNKKKDWSYFFFSLDNVLIVFSLLFFQLYFKTPKGPKGPKVSSYSFKFNSKCCNFCFCCVDSLKIVGKFTLFFLVCDIIFLDQSKMCWFLEANQSSQVQFGVQFEFMKLYIIAATSGAYISFINVCFQ